MSTVQFPTRRGVIVTLSAVAVAACKRSPPDPSEVAEADQKYAIEVLKSAPLHGIILPGVDADALAKDLEAKGPNARAKLRAALVAYAKAQHGLTIDKDAWPAEWGMRPKAYDAAGTLNAALQSGRLRAWVDEQAPQSAAYKGLQAAYVNYLTLASKGGWPKIEATAPIKPGATGPSVAALRARLAAEDGGDLGVADGPYDAGLGAAVARYQTANGLPATGVVDKQTLTALNIPVETRAAQMRASLERLRWVARTDPPTRIDVNTAAAVTDYIKDGQVALHMLSASGKPGDETPMLTSSIDHLVLNPPWNVPDGIADEELRPKGDAYLSSHGFITNEQGRLVQQPGPEAALGLVKFDFDNPFAVYLHDTPSKAAFNRTQRAVSHGCVRLEKAVDLARTVLANDGQSAGKVDELIAKGETTTVKLNTPVPVRLMYLTAFPEGGRVGFRPDIYGWDAQLLRLLSNSSGPNVAQA